MPDQLVAALVELVVAERADVEAELVRRPPWWARRGTSWRGAGWRRSCRRRARGSCARAAWRGRGAPSATARPRYPAAAARGGRGSRSRRAAAASRCPRPGGQPASPGAASPRWRRARAGQRGARRRMPPRPEESVSSGPGPPERPGDLVDGARVPAAGPARRPAATRSTSGEPDGSNVTPVSSDRRGQDPSPKGTSTLAPSGRSPRCRSPRSIRSSQTNTSPARDSRSAGPLRAAAPDPWRGRRRRRGSGRCSMS